MQNVAKRMNLVTGMNKNNIYNQNIFYDTKQQFLELVMNYCNTLETTKQGH